MKLLITYAYNEDVIQEELLEDRSVELPSINSFIDLTQYKNRMIMEPNQKDPEDDVQIEEE